MNTAIVGLVGVTAIRSAGRFFAGIISGTADAADGFRKLAQTVGISVESLQELSFAADLADTDTEQLKSGLIKLARAGDAAAKGGKDQADAFKQIGVSAKGLIDGSVTMEDALLAAADKFAAMPDGPAKAALAMQLFGKSGAEMIPFLNAGSAGIGELRQEFRDMGGVIDGQTAGQFEELNDDSRRLSYAWKAIKTQIAVALLPTLTRMAKGMIAWVKANKELIAQRVTTVIKLLIAAVKVLGFVLGKVVDVIGFLSRNAGIAIALLGSMAGAMMLLGNVSAAAGIKSALAWAAGLLPFVLLAAALLAVTLIVQDLWVWINGGDSVFKRLYKSAKYWIEERLGGVIDRAKVKLASYVGAAVAGPLGQDLIERNAESQRKGERDDKTFAATADERARNLAIADTKLSAREVVEFQAAKLGVAQKNMQLGFAPVESATAYAEAMTKLNSMGRSDIVQQVTISVSAPNADPAEVAKAVGDEFDRRLRNTKAAVGGGKK